MAAGSPQQLSGGPRSWDFILSAGIRWAVEGYGSSSPLGSHARKEEMGTEGSGNLPKITLRVHGRPRLEHWPSGVRVNSPTVNRWLLRKERSLHVLEDSFRLETRTRTQRASTGKRLVTQRAIIGKDCSGQASHWLHFLR